MLTETQKIIISNYIALHNEAIKKHLKNVNVLDKNGKLCTGIESYLVANWFIEHIDDDYIVVDQDKIYLEITNVNSFNGYLNTFEFPAKDFEEIYFNSSLATGHPVHNVRYSQIGGSIK